MLVAAVGSGGAREVQAVGARPRPRDRRVEHLAELVDPAFADHLACLQHRLRRLQVRGAAHLQRSEEHTSELQSLTNLVCRLLLEKKKKKRKRGKYIN